jgi:hypothetical protein
MNLVLTRRLLAEGLKMKNIYPHIPIRVKLELLELKNQ